MTKNPQDKFTRKRLRASYISSVISISLVLFMLGLFGIGILGAREISVWLKENIGMEIYFRSNANEADILKFKKTLDTSPFVRSTEYITKEEAAKIAEEQIGGKEAIELIGFNPLPATIVVRMNADYAHPDSLRWIEPKITANPDVRELTYREDVVYEINKNIRTFSIVLLTFSGVLLIIAIALINSTMRLAIYANRFLIKSMQLVGATRRFIQRPFIITGITQGFIGGLIALLMLGGLFIVMMEGVARMDSMSEMQVLVQGFVDILLSNLEIFAILLGSILLLGILLSWICTALAVRKYVRLRTENLF